MDDDCCSAMLKNIKSESRHGFFPNSKSLVMLSYLLVSNSKIPSKLVFFITTSSSVVCSQVLLQVEICEIKGNIFRLKIDEASPLRARYKVPDVLIKEPTPQR